MRSISILIYLAALFGGGICSRAACVKVAQANLRMHPSSRARKTWQVHRYMPLKKLGRRGAWVHVQDLDGERHWIHHQLLTSRYFCAVIKRRLVNLRRGPGNDYPNSRELPRAQKNTPFRVLGFAGQWVHLQEEFGARFWVYRPLVWIH